MTDLYVNSRLTIPADRLRWTASRSSGPGGQNVNKVNSKVTLRFDFVGFDGIDPGWKQRFREQYGSRLTTDGQIVLHSEVTRDQNRNLADARARLVTMLLSVAKAPKIRRPTKPSRSSQRRRVDNKRQKGDKKRSRNQRYSGDG